MNCMRCGVETVGKQVFCDDCLASMEKYPVKPGTAVHLPQRSKRPEPKKPVKKKREITAEEQITRLRKLVRFLAMGLAAALIALAVVGAILFGVLNQEQPPQPVSRNYTISEGA